MNLNNLKSLFERKIHVGTASLFLSLLFLFAFVLGLYIGRVDPSKDLDTFQKILLGTVLSSLVSIVATLTGYIVKEEALKISQEEIKKKDGVIQDKDNRIEKLESVNNRRISILQDVKELIIDSENHITDSSLGDLRKGVMAQISAFEQEEEAAKNIVSWLSDRENKRLLMNHATQEAMSLNPMDYEAYKEAIAIFKEDIFRCIEWLQASLIEGVPYRTKASKFANSINIIPGGLKNHKYALRAIEMHPVILNKAGDSSNLHNLINDLIYLIERDIKRSGRKNQITHIGDRSSR